MSDKTATLLKIDYQGSTWNIIEEVLQERLDGLRQRNDNHDLTVEQTAALRGQIALIRDMLRWREQSEKLVKQRQQQEKLNPAL